MLHTSVVRPADIFALNDAEYSRLIQLYQILGTGFGIRRIFSKTSRVEDLFDRYTAPIGHFVHPVADLVTAANLRSEAYGFETAGLRFLAQFVPYKLIREISETAGPLKEADMAEYRAYAREAHILRRKVIGWIPGLDAPPSAGKHPVSPFGPDRFRHFDPAPVFSQRIGFIQYHQYC